MLTAPEAVPPHEPMAGKEAVPRRNSEFDAEVNESARNAPSVIDGLIDTAPLIVTAPEKVFVPVVPEMVRLLKTGATVVIV